VFDSGNGDVVEIGTPITQALPLGSAPGPTALSVTHLTSWLTAVDSAMIVLAALAILWAGVRWSPQYSLRLAPVRRHKLREDSILLTVCVYLLGVAALAGFMDALLGKSGGTLSGLIVNNGAQIAGIVACLLVAQERFDGGWRKFLWGAVRGKGFRSAVWLAAGVTVVAIGLCPLVRDWSIETVQWLAPGYELKPHPTMEALREPTQPMAMVALLWIGAAVVAPIAEEFFFRGLLQTFMAGVVGSRWGAIALVSVVFGLVHYQQVYAAGALAVLGVLIGYAYERSGTIVVPVMIHSLFNLKTLVWDAVE